MTKSWKRFLMQLLLLPVMPILGMSGGSGSGGDADDPDKKDHDGGDAGDDQKKDPKDTSSSGDPEDKKEGEGKDTDTDDKDADKLFSQEELDAIITKRLVRERKAWEQKMEKERKKAAMSEAERLKTEKEDAEKRAENAIAEANTRLIRSEVIAQSVELDIVDSEAAYALMEKDDISVEDDGTVKGVKEALKLLIKAKPYLVKKADASPKKTGDDQSKDKGKKPILSMNDLIRKAAGR